ncbi:MAG: ABC transporter substrate-binding protein [Thermoplasmataceae archaeon]
MVSKITRAIIVIVVVAIVGIGGYEGYLHSSASSSANTTLIIASSATPASIDPAVAFDTNSVFFDDQIYQTLLGYGTETVNGTTVGTLTPVPELATNWTVYSNGSVLFNLRQNVTFSNGDPFNASDVQFSLDRVIEMSQGASFHVSQFLNASGIHVLGKYKVMLVPQAPYPWFLNLFQLWVTAIVDPNFVNAHGGVVKDSVNQYMSDHAMGTGPYMLQNYTSSDITLVANPHYWGPKPDVQKIVYEIVPNPSTQQALLEKGSVNVALNIPLDQMSTLKNYPNIKIEAGPTSSEYYIGMDENVTPFNNLDVRLAVEYAVNTINLTKYSTFGFGLPIKSAIAPTIESYIPAFQNYTQNLTKAKYYLSKSPYPHGFTTQFYYTSGDPIGQAIATILQQELQQVNINITLNAVESATFNDEVGLGQWPMFYEGWVNLLATPDDGLRPLFSGHNLGIYGNYNYFNNSTVTKDLVEAGTLYNESQRDALYKQVQNILAEQAVEVPLFNLENVIPVTSNVNDLYIYPTFDIYVSQVQMT